MTTLTGGRATMSTVPAGRCGRRAAGSRTRGRASASSSVPSPAAQALPRRRREQRVPPSPARAASPRASASAGARPSRSTATSVSPRREVRLRPGRQRARAALPGRTTIRSDGPAGSSRTMAVAAPPGVAASSASAGRHPDERDAEAVGQPLGRRDPDPQPGERARAGPDDDPRQPRPADVLLAEEPPDRCGSRVSPWR